MAPLLSVCIPAYNRADVLPALLDSILAQDFSDYEIVIGEDRSPQRAEIGNVAKRYVADHPGRIRYVENEHNLGYDGNLRRLIEIARGEYCLFMGNDDLMATGGLGAIGDALTRHRGVGVVIRSYAHFSGSAENVTQEFRYFDSERFFPAGAPSVVTAFRRSVVISGMTLHRQDALALAADRFDGTLLYQLYLVARLATRRPTVFVPAIVALYRTGGTPDFGNAAAERGRFQPHEQTAESSVHFMKGMLDIARHVERCENIPVYAAIRRDIANYSYPILSIQAMRPFGEFVRYGIALARLGLGWNIMFWIYFVTLGFIGPRRADRLIGFIKRRLGHTPAIGNVYRGDSV